MTTIIAPSRQGKLILSDWQKHLLAQEIARLDGQDVKLDIGPDRRQRTLRQNRYLWGVVYGMIAAKKKCSTTVVHDAMRQECLPKQYVTFGKEKIETRKSTTELDTEQMTKYIDDIRAFALDELGIDIPPPDEDERT